MDLFFLIFLLIISLIIGVILTLSIQYYVFYVYLKESPIVNKSEFKKSFEYSLPEAIKTQLDTTEQLNDNNKSGLTVSLILQFLFHELRHSETIKKWLYKKLTMEFDELLTKTTMGKCFESITIKDMHLGSESPDIKEIYVENVKLDDKGKYIEVLNLALNVEYSGNFLLCIDAKMKFSKTAFLSIKVKKVCGLARLQFSRQPYTHWSFSFYTEPVLELAVESHFQGRQLQSNITNLIVNQIKKSIKRKHTLPNYKIRYKPFFVKTDPSQLEIDDVEPNLQGTLEMSVCEVSRLAIPEGAQNIYLTIAVDSIPWISLYQKDDFIIMILEITIIKLKQPHLGVIFRQEGNSIIVDSVTVNSCAHQAGLKPLDVVISVENKLVNSVPQVAKLMRSIAGSNLTLRVERLVENYICKWKVIPEEKDLHISIAAEVKCDDSENELTQTEQESFIIVDNVKKDDKKPRSPKIIASNENMTKLAQTISSFSLRKRKHNLGLSSSGGSPVSTQKLNRTTTTPSKKNSITELPEIVRTEADTLEYEPIFSQIEVFKGKVVAADNLVNFDDDFRFPIKEGAKYININAWATFTPSSSGSADILLGYLNLPLNHIASECAASVLGHHSRKYSFLPPGIISTSPNHPLRAHSGFEHVFCFGDVLLTFIWNSIIISSEENSELMHQRRISIPLVVDNKGDFSSIKIKHDFVRTQFHGTTHCDFCSKKIWLKDAVQCRQCGMSCHKKCVSKCQIINTCSNNAEKIIKSGGGGGAEISLADVNILQSEIIEDDLNDTGGGNLKRVNSFTNLSIPGSVCFSSRSLPPSPQRTPSRKQSLISVNPFTFCPSALEDIQKNPHEATEVVHRLLEQVMQCPPIESLMDNAKETGQKFYVSLAAEEKKDKINLMMAELKKTLDMSTSEQMELIKKLNSEESEVEKAKLAFLIGQSDSKVHALSVLMLHYCSGLQFTQEKIL